MIKSFNELQTHISEKTLGILWPTPNTFSLDLEDFNILDFYFDGLLGQKINMESQISSAPNIFITENFGQNIFLLQFSIHEQNWKKTFQETLKILLPQNGTDQQDQNHLIIKTSPQINIETEMKKVLELEIKKNFTLTFCQ